MNIEANNLSQIIRLVDGNHDLGAGALAEAILDHLPAPQIIREVSELESLDPDTILFTPKRDDPTTARNLLKDIDYDSGYAEDLPAVIVASGEHFRNCSKIIED